jgi:hypothetical protein
MICPTCGANNKDEAVFCGKCGSKMVQPTVKCKVCGRNISMEDTFCPHCGMDRRLVEHPYDQSVPNPTPVAYPYQPTNQAPPPMYAPPTNVPCGRCGMGVAIGLDRCPYCSHKMRGSRTKDLAGIAGGLIFLAALINVTLFGMASLGAMLYPDDFDAYAAAFMVIAVLNLFAFWGAICAIRRRKYSIAIIGAIIPIFSFVFFLGIIAVVLLVISKDHFIGSEGDAGINQPQYGRYP